MPIYTVTGTQNKWNADPQGSLNYIQSGKDYLNSAVDKYILKPKTAKGINGFVFHYDGETRVNINLDITDHYTEKNTPVQDHIGLKPEKITLRGYVGELVELAPHGVQGLLSTLSNKLTTVDAYLGKYTPGAIKTIQKGISKTQSIANTIDQDLKRAQNVVDTFKGIVNLGTGKAGADKITKQRGAYIVLATLAKNKMPCTVDTPFHYYENMFIESVAMSQDEETNSYSDIIVTLKELRFATVQKPSPKVTATGRSQLDRQLPNKNGRTKGKPTPLTKVSNTYTKG